MIIPRDQALKRGTKGRLAPIISDPEHYVFFSSLEEARRHPDAAVVMECYGGGQIYLTFPVRIVRCSFAVLLRLLEALDSWAWGEGAGLFFEVGPVGSRVCGGMGGGEIADGVWLHPAFDGGVLPAGLSRQALCAEIEAIITNQKPPQAGFLRTEHSTTAPMENVEHYAVNTITHFKRVIALAEELGKSKIALIGHSYSGLAYGGSWALELASPQKDKQLRFSYAPLLECLNVATQIYDPTGIPHGWHNIASERIPGQDAVAPFTFVEQYARKEFGG